MHDTKTAIRVCWPISSKIELMAGFKSSRLPAPGIGIGWFFFEIAKEEEVTRSRVWAVRRMLYSSGSIDLE
jgi:hypothetical protein